MLLKCNSGRELAAAIDFEFVAGAVQLLVGFGRGSFAFWIDECALGFEIREIGETLEIDPVALDFFHSVIGDHHQIYRQIECVQLRF